MKNSIQPARALFDLFNLVASYGFSFPRFIFWSLNLSLASEMKQQNMIKSSLSRYGLVNENIRWNVFGFCYICSQTLQNDRTKHHG